MEGGDTIQGNGSPTTSRATTLRAETGREGTDETDPRAPSAAGTRRTRRIVRAAKWIVLLALLTALAVLAVLFWRDTEEDPTTLSVAAGPRGSDSFALMTETAAVLRRHSDTLRLDVRPTRGSSLNMALLASKRVDLATVRSDTPVASDVRAVADLFPDYFQLITGPGVMLSSFNDLEGVRIAIPPDGTEENRVFHMLLDHYDVEADEVRWRAMPFPRATARLLRGDIDALFTVRSLRDGVLVRLFEDAGLARVRLGLVPVDQADAIALKRPFITTATIPRGAYRGQEPTPPRDVETGSVTRVLVTRSDIEEEAIRELARVMFEHRLDLTIRFALAAAVREPGALSDQSANAPIHRGVQAWIDRDEPSFIQENAEPIALVVTVFSLLVSVLLTLRSRLSSAQKNRLDAYNYDLLDLGERARTVTDPSELRTIRDEHYAVLERVVRALDTDEVTEEGFQSFSLLWEGVRRVIEDRRIELGLGDGTPREGRDGQSGPSPAPPARVA